MQFATHGLSNSSFLVGELAVYTCDNGFLMVVNSSNSPVATEQVLCLQFFVSSFSILLPRQQLCACHQDPGDQPTT